MIATLANLAALFAGLALGLGAFFWILERFSAKVADRIILTLVIVSLIILFSLVALRTPQ